MIEMSYKNICESKSLIKDDKRLHMVSQYTLDLLSQEILLKCLVRWVEFSDSYQYRLYLNMDPVIQLRTH